MEEIFISLFSSIQIIGHYIETFPRRLFSAFVTREADNQFKASTDDLMHKSEYVEI